MRVRAIRRFIVRPVLPEVLKPLGDLARNLRWCWHAETQDLFRSVDPQLWERTERRPGPAAGRRVRRAAAGASTDKRFLKNLRLIQADLADYLTGDLWYQGYAAENPAAPSEHWLLLAGIRHHRGAAAVLRRPGHPGRRPSEGGQRPRRPDHRRRPALPAGLLPAVTECRRLAAGALSAAGPELLAVDLAAR